MPRSPERPAVISSTIWVWVTSLVGDVGGHPAEVERGDPVGDLEDVVHVVRDQHDAEAVVGEPADQVEHLAGLGDAERGGRLVEDARPCEFHSTALAIATVWRWPPDRLATLLAHRLHGAHRERRPASRAAICSMVGSSRTMPPRLLAAEEHVLRRCRGCRTARGPGRRSRCRARRRRGGRGRSPARPSKRYSPLSTAWMPAMHLTSVDLPAPLSPTSAVTSRDRRRSRRRAAPGRRRSSC